MNAILLIIGDRVPEKGLPTGIWYCMYHALTQKRRIAAYVWPAMLQSPPGTSLFISAVSKGLTPMSKNAKDTFPETFCVESSICDYSSVSSILIFRAGSSPKQKELTGAKRLKASHLNRKTCPTTDFYRREGNTRSINNKRLKKSPIWVFPRSNSAQMLRAYSILRVLGASSILRTPSTESIRALAA